MRVDRLRCVHFRNLEELTIQPHEGMNVICGENAQGKTNIIEAIWLFTGAKSFRVTKDSSYVRFGEEKARCELDFIFEGIGHNAVMDFAEKRRASLDEKVLASPSLLAGSFKAVVFAPGDLSIVCDGPAVRRRFLDVSIGQIYPAYIDILRDYTRAVAQRNSVIKDIRFESSLIELLDSYEAEIAAKGNKINEYRERYVNKLTEIIPDIYSGLSGGREKIEIGFIKSCEDILSALKNSRREDFITGTTSVGPHRDDLDFKINGISARSYGSQGQKRSVALSLKLAGAEVIKELSGEYPVCLLDDVMSELDPTRQNYILNHIEGMQSFLTCCDPSNTKGLQDGKIFKIENGRVI